MKVLFSGVTMWIEIALVKLGSLTLMTLTPRLMIVYLKKTFCWVVTNISASYNVNIFVYLHMCHCFDFSLHEGHTLCSVSSQNIVAFTTTTELEDISGKTWGSHVYVADLNTPWYNHKYVRMEDMTYFSFMNLPDCSSV
jgi:hypothetical protein